MFVGHTAVALAAKAKEPRTSLGGYLAAAYMLDLIWPVLLAAGVEQVRVEPGNTRFTPLAFDSYPFSHSLLMSLLWGALAAMLARMMKATGRAQVLIFLLVVSHWVLDFVTHRPDMPLWPWASSPLLGMGLWNYVPATLIIEGAMFACGVLLYARATRAKDRIGFIGFWAFVLVQFLLWVVQPWSPPPPSADVIPWAGLATWLFPLWAWWFDRHRE